MFIRSTLVVAVLCVLVPQLGRSQSPADAAPSVQSAPKVASDSAAVPKAAKMETPQLVVPADTTIPVELRVALNSRTAYAGQAIYCDTVYPITVNNRIIIPVGSYIKGKITQVVRPGRVKGRAQIGLRFDSITLPNGTTRDLRATLSGFGGTGNEGFNPKEGKVEGESTKGKDVGTVAQTAGEGAVIGAIANRGLKGASIGGGAGALGGLVWVLATRGKDVVLVQGTNLELQLSQPLGFYPDEVDFPMQMPVGPTIPHSSPGL